jgi:transposase
MFLRRCERRKAGKTHTYWALVESYRTAQGSRQRVVAYLGELKPSQQNGWAKLAKRLPLEDRPQPSLFDPPPPDDEVEEEVLVQLRGIRLENLRDFGDVWLAWGLWRLLELDTLLDQHLPAGREDVRWGAVAAILTIARFCAPKSELHIEHTWYRRTALNDLIGVPIAQVHTDRLYAGLDRLLPLKETIEQHLQKRLRHLFDFEYDLLLYDITSTYFEGDATANPQAKRGYSRDSRPDRPQVCIGLVVTRDGLPLGYEVFAGNRHDSTTVQEIIATMEARFGTARRIWVMDRGMVSEANLQFLRDRGGQYIVGTPKAMMRQFERDLAGPDWQTAQAGVEVKLVPGPDGDETFILTRSADRRLKEQAMNERFVARLEEGLRKMQASATSGRLRDEGEANRRLGRLLAKNWRASRAFQVRIERLAEPVGKAHLRVTYERDPQWSEWSALSQGCYVLRTNLVDMAAPELWKHYMQLVEAEWAFRIAKDELRLRPIWHQREDRVQAHILVCFMAYVLWKTLGQWMRPSGLGDAPRTVVSEFAKIQSGDIVLPASTPEGTTKEVRLRCVTTPDAAQKVLLNRLGLKLPTRLRPLEEPLPV